MRFIFFKINFTTLEIMYKYTISCIIHTLSREYLASMYQVKNNWKYLKITILILINTHPNEHRTSSGESIEESIYLKL